LKVDLVTNLLKSESKSKSSKNGLKSGLEYTTSLQGFMAGEVVGYMTLPGPSVPGPPL